MNAIVQTTTQPVTQPQCGNLRVSRPIPPRKRRKLSSHKPKGPQSLFPVPNGNKMSTLGQTSSTQTASQFVQEKHNDIDYSPVSQTRSPATIVPDTQENMAMGEIIGNTTSSNCVTINSSLDYLSTKIPIAPDAPGEDSISSTPEVQSTDVIVSSDITQPTDTQKGPGDSESCNSNSSAAIGGRCTLSHPTSPQDIGNISSWSSEATFVTPEHLITESTKPKESILDRSTPIGEILPEERLSSRPPTESASASRSQELGHGSEIVKSTASSRSYEFAPGSIGPEQTCSLYLDREQSLESSFSISSTHPELLPHNGPSVTISSDGMTTRAQPNNDRLSSLPVEISLDYKANSERLENCSISSLPSSVLSLLSRRFSRKPPTFSSISLLNNGPGDLSPRKQNSSPIPHSTASLCAPAPDPGNSNFDPLTPKNDFPPITPESTLPSGPPIPAASPIAEPPLTRLTIPVQSSDPSSSPNLTPELDTSNSNTTLETPRIDLSALSAMPTPIVSSMKAESNESSAPSKPNPLSHSPAPQTRQRYSSPRTSPLISMPHFEIYIQACPTQPISFNSSLPSKILASSKLPLDFFTLYTHQSNLALSSLETLTFILPFAENIKFVVHKNWTEREWTQFRRRLRGLVEIAHEKDEDVEVWIEIGDSKRTKSIKDRYAGL